MSYGEGGKTSHFEASKYLSDGTGNKGEDSEGSSTNRSKNNKQRHKKKMISSIVERKARVIFDDPGDAKTQGSCGEEDMCA